MKNLKLKLAFGIFNAATWVVNKWYDFPDWIKYQKSKFKKHEKAD